MRREDVERIVWKVLSGLTPRPSAGDVDLIMTAMDAYTATVRQRHSREKRPAHYAPMPAVETACGIVNAGNKLLRLTGSPADVECENCKATERWRNDMTVERVRYG